MSRCFPFPPPGYEKARSDDSDLLAKEKQKEKKHKKEKKDKEKSEGKEKKDKDKSKDKHREKKDRKEKHKDRKKDKDRDKDKNRTSDQKRNEERVEGCNGQLGESSHQALLLRDSKFVEELGKRIRDEATGSGNQVVENFIGNNQKRNEGIGRAMEKEAEKRTEGKDKSKDRQGDDRRAEKQRNRDEQSVISKEMVRIINDTNERAIEGSRSKEKEPEKRIEGKEKNHKGKEGDDRRGEKHKNKESEEKRSKGKDKDRDKEKKKTEKVKEHNNHKFDREEKLRESGVTEQINHTLNIKAPYPPRTEQVNQTLNIKPPYPPKRSESIAGAEGNVKKRKDFETNGYLHENDVRPNKLTRPASSFHPPFENGIKLEPSHTAIPCTNDRQGGTDSKKGEINKGHRVNGVLAAQPSSVVPRPSISVEASENGEASTRPPHPDTKYLSQIFSIPKLEEWSDFDEQEWLFGSHAVQLKPKAVACDASQVPQVWAEALRIESDDFCALPYVIPY